ncbi:histidine kinase [Pseudobacter ginsenosidimutans]|uniref:7TMR-DISM extracellular protein 2 n=1 Tax=Pseudobacter ginsenosidimutans TaxID=661488 RepID=A0A4Q7N571_9BACT|nr:histidine kinase [Pseudobacter ginsenosidimutans]QEC44659.1 hypothetical protein FSB84_24360 [Pseudobacter ginsenosidimutans]RZS76140.1 7TMR-DISM extracellular protein 2 [Pseudobacter ginsenosidimutans]
MVIRRFLTLLAGWLVCIHCSAQTAIVFNGQPAKEQALNITGQTFFYEDLSGDTLSFAEIIKQPFIPLPAERLKPFIASRPLIVNWLKFRVSNTSATDTVSLVFNCNFHAFVHLYEDSSNGVATSSLVALRETLAREPDQPVVVPPGTTNTYYVRIIEKIEYLMPLAAELFTPGLYQQMTIKGKNDGNYLFLFMSMATGCLLFMTIFAAYQYWLTKDKAFLYYAAYVLCASAVWLIIADHRFNLHLFDVYKDRPHILVSSGIAFFYALFIAHILELPHRFPGQWKILKALLWLIVLETLVEISDNLSGRFLFSSNLYYLQLMHIPNLLINAYLIWLLVIVKSPFRKYLLAGMLSLFLFLFVISRFVFSISGLSPQITAFVNFPPFWGILGVVAEAICFALALAYRSKRIQDEKNKLQEGYTNQLKTELEKQASEMEQQHRLLEHQKLHQMETAFEKKLAETEMIALRAQMNPHFIFNCLNSIKLYTLENDSETASSYLTTFSRLIRLVLDNSRSEKVTLQNEIETIRLYIELEVMRFKNKVSYDIRIDENIDTAYIEIPPLLLQPYIENAIWHGLMHKEEGGKVIITLSQPHGQSLHAEIVDNGIGREMAALYKSKSIIKHKSFGVKMTNERLQIINQLYNIQARIEITDLKNNHGIGCGTKVSIDIPI